MKDFNIFGSMNKDKTQISTINNQKHREIPKDKYKSVKHKCKHRNRYV